MKAVINEKETPVKYPMLKISDSGSIVFFTKASCGVLFKKGDTTTQEFSYSEEWIESKFTPFTGSITLSND